MQQEKEIKILAIETSCDETAAAIISGVEDLAAGNLAPKILSNIVSSQVDIHAKTGGVVPEVASRAHMEAIIPVISEALTSARQKQVAKNTTPQDLYHEAIASLQNDIDYIAVTAGPGLIGSLLVGYNAAKTIAYSLNKPIIPINHIEGHIYSALINLQAEPMAKIDFPILSLTVSGGHSSLNLMFDHGKYQPVGQTIDDAAGEAFDKVAKLLDLGYPGGPAVSKLALQFREHLKLNENSKGIVFPRPIINDGTFNFSFSGLKTAVLQHILNIKKERDITEEDKKEICGAFEDAVVDVLVTKTIRAVKKYQPKAVILAGGVAANKHLRDSLRLALEELDPGLKFCTPDIKLCGDNAAMIGVAAYYHAIREDFKNWNEITLDSNLEL